MLFSKRKVTPSYTADIVTRQDVRKTGPKYGDLLNTCTSTKLKLVIVLLLLYISALIHCNSNAVFLPRSPMKNKKADFKKRMIHIYQNNEKLFTPPLWTYGFTISDHAIP